MTTVSLNNELYRQASEVAAAQGKTMDQFVGEALQQAVAIASVRQSIRNGLPVMMVGKQAAQVDLNKVRDLLQEDGF